MRTKNNEAAKLSARMQLVSQGAALSVALGIAALPLWLIVSPQSLVQYLQSEVFPQAAFISSTQASLLVALSCAQFALLFMALRALARMFGAFAGADPLNVEASLWMQRCGLWLLACALFSILAQVPASFTASLFNQPGERFITIGLASTQMMGLLASGVLIAVAKVQGLAATMRQEHKLIV